MRRRLERGEPISGTVTLSAATAEQRDAMARLLGRRPRGGATVSVRLEDVDALLRRSGAHPGGLADGVVALTGPVHNRAEVAAAAEAAWSRAFGPLHTAVADRPELHEWARGLRETGAVRRVARDPDTARELLTRLAAVLAALPTEPEPVGRFAERILGSAHALDTDRPLTGLVFGAARALGAVGEGAGAPWRREVWASVGLVRDELSSTVLVLNLPTATGTPTGRVLAELREAGEPVVLTLRQLRQPPQLPASGATVSICENPVVVAEAAERLGPAAGPLVCVGGQPGVAVMTLLRSLAGQGAGLRYHGDFDWGGLRIGNLVFGRLPAVPWRFDADAYRRAAALGEGRPLAGEPTTCGWDTDLDAAMRQVGRAVEEEGVLDDLLHDLVDPAGSATATRR
ncbi:TIGR02679 family protein [Pseudonocardia sp. MH-G8]|uniref:TIGR02679 family protein n=1 Tax=Pseudonocardia sp. MH-G8 TaxID=1854588 RepID=UPI001E32F84E|nr:TIGR02679 family protein [Pseudonocardia sp. MH-G8]